MTIGKPALLYENVKQHIYTDLVEPMLQDGGRLPSNRDLSTRFGVTTATVSKALHELANEGYLRKQVGAGTYVLPRQARTQAGIGVWYETDFHHLDRLSEFQITLDYYLQERLSRSGIPWRHYVDARLDNLRETPPPQLLDDLAARRLSVLIVFADARRRQSWLGSCGVPVLALDRDHGWGRVHTALRQAGHDAATHLLARGCRRLWLVTPSLHEWTMPAAEEVHGRILRAGMSEVLAEHGLPSPTPFSKADLPEPLRQNVTADDVEIGRLLFHRIWKLYHPDGVLAGTDLMGVGTVTAMRELGLVHGRDLRVLALCNRQLPRPELAAIDRFELDVAVLAEHLAELAARIVRRHDEGPLDIAVPYLPASASTSSPETAS